MRNKSQRKDKKISFSTESLTTSLFTITLIMAGAAVGVAFFAIQLSTIENNIAITYTPEPPAVYAQMNSKQGSSTTIIGDVVIPYSTSNDTKTTVVNNSTNSTISTSIDRSAIALNSTATNNFAKEPPTSPISPTGISTEGLQQPPGHRIINNNAIPMGK
jgi:hypothetical protein